jgi:hypothetical protein
MEAELAGRFLGVLESGVRESADPRHPQAVLPTTSSGSDPYRADMLPDGINSRSEQSGELPHTHLLDFVQVMEHRKLRGIPEFFMNRFPSYAHAFTSVVGMM